jgi:transcriptional regulator GlxA family with amidase domain
VTLAVGILLYDGVELLDFAGPYEVFTVASRVRLRDDSGAEAPFEVFTVADGPRPVRTHAGLLVVPDRTITLHPHIDLLVVPGGVVDGVVEDAGAVDWVARTSATAQLTASVCTGAFLLARAGILEGRAATTHWEDVDDLQAAYPGLLAVKDCRWVDDGDVVTAAGIAAGIDMALHLVVRLAGDDLALQTARYMQYEWSGDSPAKMEGSWTSHPQRS